MGCAGGAAPSLWEGERPRSGVPAHETRKEVKNDRKIDNARETVRRYS
jgi:hypothetical protein